MSIHHKILINKQKSYVLKRLLHALNLPIIKFAEDELLLTVGKKIKPICFIIQDTKAAKEKQAEM